MTPDEYEVTLACIFEATDFQDALSQMTTWVSDQAFQAGYRVKNLRTGESVFIDAEDGTMWPSELVSKEDRVGTDTSWDYE